MGSVISSTSRIILLIFIIRRLGDRASSLLTLFYCSRGGRPFFSQLPGRTYNSSFCLSLASLSFLAKKSTIYKVCQLQKYMVLFSDILCYIGTPSSETQSAGREKRHDESQARAEEPLVIITYETISKRSSEFWLLIGHKRCFALPCPIGEQHLLSSFWVFVHDGYYDVILVLKLTQLCPVAAYCRQILLSLGTVGIFC